MVSLKMPQLTCNVTPSLWLPVEVNHIYPLYTLGVLTAGVRKGLTAVSRSEEPVNSRRAKCESDEWFGGQPTVHKIQQVPAAVQVG